MHIEPWVFCGPQVLHDKIIGVAAEPVVGFPQSVHTHPEYVGGYIEGGGAVGCCCGANKAFLRVLRKFTEGMRTITPEQRLSSLEDHDGAARLGKGIDGSACGIPVHVCACHSREEMERAGQAGKVTPVGELEARDQRDVTLKDA